MSEQQSYPHAGKYHAVGHVLKAAGQLAPGEYIRWETRELAPGDPVGQSRQWDDGDLTGKTLKGASVLDPAKASRLSQVDLTSKYEGVPYVVRGKRLKDGEDPGEILLNDAKVVRKIDMGTGGSQ